MKVWVLIGHPDYAATSDERYRPHEFGDGTTACVGRVFGSEGPARAEARRMNIEAGGDGMLWQAYGRDVEIA